MKTDKNKIKHYSKLTSKKKKQKSIILVDWYYELYQDITTYQVDPNQTW